MQARTNTWPTSAWVSTLPLQYSENTLNNAQKPSNRGFFNSLRNIENCTRLHEHTVNLQQNAGETRGKNARLFSPSQNHLIQPAIFFTGASKPLPYDPLPSLKEESE